MGMTFAKGTVGEVIARHMAERGYTGLYNGDAGCACEDARECDGSCTECSFGWWVECETCELAGRCDTWREWDAAPTSGTVDRKYRCMALSGTTDERELCRAAFVECGLSYGALTDSGLALLAEMVNKAVDEAAAADDAAHGRVWRVTSSVVAHREDGAIESAFLRMSCGEYPDGSLEAVSFNRDGFVGFAGWASDRNVKPIAEAFCEWCEVTAACKGA